MAALKDRLLTSGTPRRLHADGRHIAASAECVCSSLSYNPGASVCVRVCVVGIDFLLFGSTRSHTHTRTQSCGNEMRPQRAMPASCGAPHHAAVSPSFQRRPSLVHIYISKSRRHIGGTLNLCCLHDPSSHNPLSPGNLTKKTCYRGNAYR